MTAYRLGSPFQDHMVLQRDRPLAVWGWAPPGQSVSVALAAASVGTTADVSGRWMALLPPQPASGPLDMTITAGDAGSRLQDVWLGELWLASGQSNMEMKLADCRDAEREIADARYPGIRVFTSERQLALTPRDTVGGFWQVCHPDTAGTFSAVGYCFARELHRSLGVAVGVIDSSWGGTPAEAWTSREGLLGDPALRGYIDRLDRLLGPEGHIEREACARARREWETSIPADPGNAGETNGWHLSETPDADWNSMVLPISWQTAGYNFSGIFWFRRDVEIPTEWAGRELDLSIGACDKRDHTYFDGRFLGSLGMEDDPLAWTKTRVYRIPGADVKAGRRTIAVRVFSNVYQGGMIGPATDMWLAPADATEAERRPLHGAWYFRVERDFGRITAAPPPMTYGPDNPNTPSVLFNGMIAPLIPLALRGFIWYQGESNTTRATEYRTLFPNLIRDWRRVFGQGPLPFYFVQLANFKGETALPVESDWAQLREAQRQTLEVVCHTGMAVTIDIGDASDIHPKNKQDVGRRLADCALALVYDRSGFVGSSPLPLVAWRRQSSVAVRFTSVAGGLRTRGGGSLQGFALAGENRVFHWVEAEIDGVEGVTLHCAETSDPRWVRYAWADNPRCNLDGGVGLPASPFEVPIPFGAWLLPSQKELS